MNPTHDWHIDTHSMELVIRRDEVDSVGVSLGHDNIDDAHSTTILTSRLIEMILTVQPDALAAHDRAVEAEALREAADEIRHRQHAESVRKMLRSRADEMEKEAGREPL